MGPGEDGGGLERRCHAWKGAGAGLGPEQAEETGSGVVLAEDHSVSVGKRGCGSWGIQGSPGGWGQGQGHLGNRPPEIQS